MASGVFADETPTDSKDGATEGSSSKEKAHESNIEELAEGGATEEERAQLEKKQQKAKSEDEEGYAKGSVGWKTYKLYFKSLSPSPFVIFVFGLPWSFFSSPVEGLMLDQLLGSGNGLDLTAEEKIVLSLKTTSSSSIRWFPISESQIF